MLFDALLEILILYFYLFSGISDRLEGFHVCHVDHFLFVCKLNGSLHAEGGGQGGVEGVPQADCCCLDEGDCEEGGV